MENQLKDLAMQVHNLESEGMQISWPWYELEPAEPAELTQLRTLVDESLSRLNQMSTTLDAQLKDGVEHSNRDREQYAYNLVQELIVSRTSVIELIGNTLQHPYEEFLRAIAIKEKAAQDQSQQLLQTLTAVRPS